MIMVCHQTNIAVIFHTEFFLERNILMLIGGLSGTAYQSTVETVDIGGTSGLQSCSTNQKPLPQANGYPVGILDGAGYPLACGGMNIPDPAQCNLYTNEFNIWVDEGPVMTYPRDDGGTSVRLSDGRFLVIGSDVAAE